VDEPRVVTEDVKAILDRALSQFDADDGDSVGILAERAGTSTRTVYRVLQLSSQDLSLDLADRLVVAAGGNISLDNCRLRWPDGRIEA
jgi:hypothetical protein